MPQDNPRSTARLGGHPIYPMLLPFPIVCFVGTFLTDLAYWGTASVQWETFSIWLLATGLVVAVFAVVAGLFGFLRNRRIRSLGSAWVHVAGIGAALVLSVVNAFVHSRDGYTAVVPVGLVLSGTVVVILAVAGWTGLTMVFRHRVGVVG